VKIDVRITADEVPVIAHSSPIENFESDDCDGLLIEESTAAQVTACHRYPSATETFQRLDEVLEYLRGKMVAQLTVKRSEDYAGAIAAVLDAGAEDFAFFEIEAGDLEALIPAIPDNDRVWYLVQVNDLATEVDLLLDDLASPRAFMFEFEPTDDVADLVETRLHPAGVRSFTYDRAARSVEEIRALYDGGFDVVSTQFGDSGVAARMQVNEARGVSPP
jgi:glycerophosphoryl diester phosphodiesterase